MIKYLNYSVTFQEVPNEISLCFNITNCQFHCAGCHSIELRDDIGYDLEKDIIDIVKLYDGGVTCVCFLGEGNDPDALERCLRTIKAYDPKLNTALYTGADHYSDAFRLYINAGLLDYIKLGPYVSSLGGIDKPTTNQRMYKIENCIPCDITYMFEKKGHLNNETGIYAEP